MESVMERVMEMIWKFFDLIGGQYIIPELQVHLDYDVVDYNPLLCNVESIKYKKLWSEQLQIKQFSHCLKNVILVGIKMPSVTDTAQKLQNGSSRMKSAPDRFKIKKTE